jgi:hypothetical protein
VTWEPDYITSAELKAELRITDSVDDTPVARWVTAASRAVDNFCHRQFGNTGTVQTRDFTAEWDRHVGCYVAELDDLGNVDDLVILYGTTEITDYTLYPKNALSKGGVYERAHFSLSLAASPYAPAYWGVPGRYSKIDLVIDGLGVAGSPSEGSELRLLAKVDPDVETVIGKKYRREWWAA